MNVTLSDTREQFWELSGLSIATLCWGNQHGRPLLAIHGWLDNALSFAHLAPLLANHQVVAPDLSGHGRSAWRSSDANYEIWDDLPDLVELLDQLGWQSFDLLGHSRGAAIATLLAAALPGRVSNLVLLDGIAPEPVPEATFPTQLRKGLQDKRALSDKAGTVFANAHQAIDLRVRKGLPVRASEGMVPRSLKPCEGGVTWSHDPRLQAASLAKMTERQVEAVLAALDMPVMLLMADDRAESAARLRAFAEAHVDSILVREVSGGHHFHMEEGVSSVAQLLQSFLSITEETEQA
ncbi:MAG: alpha/beta fold hydrolase [Pseudomonadota bacterium]